MKNLGFDGRRLILLGVLSSLLSFVFSGLDVLYTLYALKELDISAAEWSQIRAYRFLLTIIMVMVLGTYAGKIGQKNSVALTVALAVVNLLLFIVQPSKLLLFMTLPFQAAVVSMVTMSMNVLAQEVPSKLQSISNTVYRSTYTGLAIIGPLAIALLSDYSPRLLFGLFTLTLALCLPLFILFPNSNASGKAEVEGAAGQTFRQLMREWRCLLKNKSFIYYELLVTIIYSAFLVNMNFWAY